MAGSSSADAPADTLRRDLVEAREHLAAVGEVLAVLGRAGSDVDAILGAVVDKARELCRADAALIYLLDQGVYHVARASGVSEEVVAYLGRYPFSLDEGTLIGRVGLTRRAGHIEDVLTDPQYARSDAQRVAGYRTVMAAPMLIAEEYVGVLNLWRYRVEPFDARAMTLTTAFAAHAAVAIRNVHLVRALEQRSNELEVASKHKSEFLASMSHELRTPLNAIIGFSEVLLERMFGELNEKQDEYLRDILSGGRHCFELLNDILDLSKVEAGQWSCSSRPFRSARRGVRPDDGPGARPPAWHHTRLDVAADVGGIRGGRASLQAGRAQPALQRGEVHTRRRPGHCERPATPTRSSSRSKTQGSGSHRRP